MDDGYYVGRVVDVGGYKSLSIQREESSKDRGMGL
jgi:hypothetical protein